MREGLALLVLSGGKFRQLGPERFELGKGRLIVKAFLRILSNLFDRCVNVGHQGAKRITGEESLSRRAA